MGGKDQSRRAYYEEEQILEIKKPGIKILNRSLCHNAGAPSCVDKLERLLAAKARTLEGDPRFRLKMLKFGLSRGYEYDAVEEALKNLGR